MNLKYFKDCSFEELVDKAKKWKSEGESIALCHGCFDPLHVGHIKHFLEASKCADKLIVTMTSDEFIHEQGRPFIEQNDRVLMLSVISCIDACAINKWRDAVETIKKIRPDYYIKGKDYQEVKSSALLKEIETVEEMGGSIYFTESEKMSSTDLISKGAFNLSQGIEIREYNEKDYSMVIDIIGTFSDENKKYAEAEFRGYLKLKGSKYYVAVIQERIVGILGYRMDYSKDASDIYWAEWGYVHKNYWRRGIGTLLWDKIEGELKEKGCRKLYIDVGNAEEHKIAIEMYFRRGYKQEGYCPDYWAEGEDYLIFAKRLN